MGIASFGPLDALSQALPMVLQDVQRIGPDLRVVARVQGRDGF